MSSLISKERQLSKALFIIMALCSFTNYNTKSVLFPLQCSLTAEVPFTDYYYTVSKAFFQTGEFIAS